MCPQFLQSIRSRLPWLDRLSSETVSAGRVIALTGVTLTAVILGARYLGLLQGMELAAYDQLVRLQPDEGEDDRLLVVGITEADLQQLQQWPVSDRIIAQALAKLSAQQPRVIGLDVMRDIPIEPGRDELLQQFQQLNNLVAVCKASSTDEPGTPPPPNLPDDRIGFSDLVVDQGGILRRSLLVLTPPASLVSGQSSHPCNSPGIIQSLGLQLALRYLQGEGIEGRVDQNNVIWLGDTPLQPLPPRLGGYQSVDASGYQVMLRYRSEERAVRQVSLNDLLQGRVPSEWVSDRIVLIGYTTSQAKDEFYTPYSASRSDRQNMSGVVVHAQAVSQLLSVALDGRSLIWAWGAGWEALWVMGWALVGSAIGWSLRHPLRLGAALGLSVVAIYGVSYGLFLIGGWIPLMPGAIAVVMGAVGVVLVDRFNRSEYGQNVYRQVKTFLKINIDIDHDKLQKQVSEITETDYFKELSATVKELRNQKSGLTTPSRPAAGESERSPSAPKSNVHPNVHPDKHPDRQATDSSIDADPSGADAADYFNPSNASAPPPTANAQSETESDDSELDYFAQLKRESKRLKDAQKPPDSPAS
ncbi:MAG TPA: CHASE2 domain-containing protein [Chroococcidiopsis sp.]